jgi:DNA gyrase subunit A
MRAAYADDRRTTIEDLEFEQDIEDLIQREDMVVTVTYTGYIKRVPLSTYRAQRRGGKGRAGMSTREGDFVSRVFVTSTHTRVLFFSTRGIVYDLKVYKLPLGSPQARGKAMVNLLPLAEGETISTVLPLPEDEGEVADSFVMFATTNGDVRRNRLSDFVNIKANGKIAMKLQDDARLVNVRICTESQDVLLATRLGMCIRFPVPDVRVFEGRTSTGVRGIRLDKGDEVISMSMLDHAEIDVEQRDAYLKIASSMRRAGENGEGEAAAGELPTMPQEAFDAFAAAEQFILVVTEKGFGKRTSAYEYRITGRGGKGVGNIEVTERNGSAVAAFAVDRTDHIMLVTDAGQLIRCPVDDIRIAGRLTQGVTLFRVGDVERVVSVARLREDSEDGDDDVAGADDGRGT